MKTFDEYWKEHATDEFLSKEGVKILCADMSKELLKEIKALKIQLEYDYDLPNVSPEPISRTRYKMIKIKTPKK